MIYIKIILLLMSFVGYVTYITKFSKLNVIQAPFLFCCFTSIFLYAFAIVGALVLGTYLVLVVGLLLFAFCIYKQWLNIHTFKLVDIKYFIFTAPYFALYFAISKDFKFLGWDEFSFWASSQKLIFETGELYKEHSPIFFKSYPPAQQLFQYYLTKLTFWSEKNVLFAQIFWVLSGLMCVAGTLITRPLQAAITFLTSCAFLYYFNFSFVTLYSDPLLGVCFAASVALAYKNKTDLASTLALFLSMAILVLIKEIGIFLALVALSIAFINRCIELGSVDTSRFKKILPAITATLVLAIGLLAVMKTWSWYLGTINALRQMNLPVLADFSNSPLRERSAQTMIEFWARLAKPNYLEMANAPANSSTSIAAFAIRMIALSTFLIFITSRHQRVKIVATTFTLAAGAIAYTVVLLFSFLVLFTEYEGVRLASFERYLSTYTIAWFLILYSLLASEIFSRDIKFAALSQLVCISLVIYFVPRVYFQDIRKIESVGPINNLRISVDNFALAVKKNMGPDEKVYFIAQNSNGLERAIFTYAMLPFTSSTEWCWSLGEKYYDGDVWTCNTSLKNVLKGYDYLALYSADTQFWQTNAALFNSSALGTKSGIFKINRKVDGGIQSLTKIDKTL